MAKSTELNKRYINNMCRAGMLRNVQFEDSGSGCIATVTTNEGTVHRFENGNEWNKWWDARCPRVPVGFNPIR